VGKGVPPAPASAVGLISGSLCATRKHAFNVFVFNMFRCSAAQPLNSERFFAGCLPALSVALPAPYKGRWPKADACSKMPDARLKAFSILGGKLLLNRFQRFPRDDNHHAARIYPMRQGIARLWCPEGTI